MIKGWLLTMTQAILNLNTNFASWIEHNRTLIQTYRISIGPIFIGQRCFSRKKKKMVSKRRQFPFNFICITNSVKAVSFFVIQADCLKTDVRMCLLVWYSKWTPFYHKDLFTNILSLTTTNKMTCNSIDDVPVENWNKIHSIICGLSGMTWVT